MPQENVEATRAAIDAVNRRDADALVALSDPEIEFHAYFSDVLGATFKGYEGLRAYIREITDSFEAFHIDIDTIEGREGFVVAKLHALGRGRASGADVEWRACYVARLRDGKGWRVASRPTEQAAVQAVGLPSATG